MRKWLTYTALVITASIVIGDVVTSLAYFLRGDLNSRFLLKVLSILVIAGGVFAYYLVSLQRETVSSSRNGWFAIAALALVGFGIAAGFMQIGSPGVQRSAAEDTHRLSDLSSLAHVMHDRWLARRQEGFVLPATIQELGAKINLPDVSVVDPVTASLRIRLLARYGLSDMCHILASQPGRYTRPVAPRRWACLFCVRRKR